MNKKKHVWLCILTCMVFILFVLYFRNNLCQNISHSEGNSNEYTKSIIEDYSVRYHHKFEPASAQIENRLYGVWQAKELVGWDNSREIQWDGLYGDIVIFSGEAWIYGGHPGYKPVYACYSADFEDMKQDLFLNIVWKDNRYEGCIGIVGIAISSEKNNNRSPVLEERILKFILIEDTIIIEVNGSYFRLEKVGEIEMSDLLENVKPN